jgi:hypothetical protein
MREEDRGGDEMERGCFGCGVSEFVSVFICVYLRLALFVPNANG